jgi:ABC-2 type transport system permease protein
MAIGLGFDAVNSEYNQRTLANPRAADLSRRTAVRKIHCRPAYVITFSLVALWLLVIGFGLYLLGVPPSLEETACSSSCW